jgi:hypothetical protein
LLQLDFDDSKLEGKGWEDVGLMGALYVYKVDASAFAVWQYT